MNAFPWNIFFILLAAGIFGTLAVMPYALSMNPQALEKLKEAQTAKPGEKAKLPLPVPVVLLLSGVQNAMLVGLAAFLGLLASQQIGLGTPILQAAVAGQDITGLIGEMLPMSILLGLITGAAIMALEAAYFMPRVPRKLAGLDSQLALWKRVLACFYGGIVEEILMRLFVMGGLAWLLGLVWKDATAGLPAAGAFWAANILATLLFGAGHLPATAAVVRLSPIVVARALLLNGIPGVALGYLYMRYGIEAAMLAHFCLDILIHLILPPLMHYRARFLPHDPAAQAA